MPDDQQHRRYRPVDLTTRRECRFLGCRRRSVRGHAFCGPHGVSDEAVAYYRELHQASAYFDLALQSIDPDKADRYEAFHRFRRRAQRGDFATLLDKPTRALIEQAAALPDHRLEVGALRFALARAVAEEIDPTRLGLTVARLTHAIARIAAANPPPTDADKATTAAIRLLDTALTPTPDLPSPNHGRGAGAEGRNAGQDPSIDEDKRPLTPGDGEGEVEAEPAASRTDDLSLLPEGGADRRRHLVPCS